MEETVESIKSLAEHILPKQPYYLSLFPTRKYQVSQTDRLDEETIIPLQYSTLVGGEADRGVLLTRAYYSIQEEPNSSNAPAPTTLKVDPNKPRKKVSLKDYKNKKADGDSPPKQEDKVKEKEQSNGLYTIKEKEEGRKQAEPVSKAMDSRRDGKKSALNAKVEATRQRSRSPELRKRLADGDEGPKPTKRVKLEDVTLNGTTRPSKDTNSQKSVRSIPLGKNESKDVRMSSATNGKLAPSNSNLRTGSLKHSSQTNGHGKGHAGQMAHKKTLSSGEPISKTVPRLLSPLHIADLSVDKSSGTFKESILENRPSPKKKITDMNSSNSSNGSNSTITLKNSSSGRDRDLSPGPKRRRVPPLLSPTLPPIVMEELARMEAKLGTPSKESSQKSGQVSDSSVTVKKPTQSIKEEAIHVENKQEERASSFIVTMKYRKRNAKTIERLLNLPSGGKKKAEGLKRDDRTRREASGSVEPGTARKRPRTTDPEPVKRPKTSDTLRPSTPPKQSTAMSRIASNSSQAGTPGAANSLTPSSQLPAEKRRDPITQEKLQRAQRLHGGHKFFMELGTKLKHERDAIMKNKDGVQERERQTAVAAGIQSLLSYMYAVKLQSDALDLERLPRRAQAWREILPLFRVARADCARHPQLVALLLRIQGICTHYMQRTLWFLQSEADIADKFLSITREEAEIWRTADHARRKLGVLDNEFEPWDGGAVGQLIDRLGPWSTPEEAIPVTLEIMRIVITMDGSWKAHDELTKIGRALVSNPSV